MSRSLLGRTLTFVLTQYCDDKYFFLMVLTAAKKKEKNIIAYISLSSVLTPEEKKKQTLDTFCYPSQCPHVGYIVN